MSNPIDLDALVTIAEQAELEAVKAGYSDHYIHRASARAVATAVLERAADEMHPILRSMISRGEAADAIRALMPESRP